MMNKINNIGDRYKIKLYDSSKRPIFKKTGSIQALNQEFQSFLKNKLGK